MPTFPDLKYSESYSYEVSPSVNRTEYASLNSRQRFIVENRDDLFSASIRVDNSDLGIFEDFIIDDLENGSLTYDGPYYVGDVEKTGTLQILNGEYNVSYLTSDYWEVAFQYELKDRDMTDEEAIYDLVNAFGGFGPIPSVFSALANLVNNNELNA